MIRKTDVLLRGGEGGEEKKDGEGEKQRRRAVPPGLRPRLRRAARFGPIWATFGQSPPSGVSRPRRPEPPHLHPPSPSIRLSGRLEAAGPPQPKTQKPRTKPTVTLDFHFSPPHRPSFAPEFQKAKAIRSFSCAFGTPQIPEFLPRVPRSRVRSRC